MEKRDLVIMFLDIHLFARLAVSFGGALHEFVQEFYERVGDCIVSFGGKIIKYIGDSILCVFPSGEEAQAVRCGLQMRNVYADILRQRGILTESELEVAISSGEVATGVFGHRSLRLEDVFGDAVQQAAVLTHHRGVAISETVYRSIDGVFETEPLPDVPVKWMEKPLKAWNVLGPGASA